MGCSDCNRRQFLKVGVQSLSAVALTAAGASFLMGCDQQPLSSATGPGPGPAATLPNNGNNVYTFNFSDYPALQNVGGSITVAVNATSGSKSLFVTRVDANTVDTVSTICTHAGCTLNAYDSTAMDYTCPCHGSVFNVDGSVSVGPATQALPSYAGAITATGVQVTIP